MTIISGYSTLQREIARLLVRDDLRGRFPTYIALAEADLNRRIDHWRGDKTATLSLTSRLTDLPADLISIRRLFTTRPLEPVSQDWLADQRYCSMDEAGVPRAYAITGAQLEVWPAPTEATPADLVYRARLPELANNRTNWLLDISPGAYLYGSLLVASKELQDEEAVRTYAALYDAAIESVNGEGAPHGGTLRIR